MTNTPPPTTPPRPPRRPTPPERPQRNWLLFALLAGGLILSLTSVALVTTLVLRNTVFEEAELTPAMTLEVVKLTATPLDSPLPAPSECETIISSGDVEVTVSLPVSLSGGMRALPVTPVVPQETFWRYPPEFSGPAAWICGTVVNYVIELDPTPENQALLAELRPGDELRLHLSNGTTLLFRFTERQATPAADAGTLAQLHPRLTLILPESEALWQVALAEYVAEAEKPPVEAGPVAQVGQTVRIGDVQLAVNRSYTERDAAGLEPGTMYYLIEFSLENVSDDLLDTDAFTMKLQDGVGNEYLLSPVASNAGEYGMLEGSIAPGGKAIATAGYLVPIELQGPNLTWTFSPQATSTLRASVRIPYETRAVEPPPATAVQAAVGVTDAFLSRDGETLIIEGEIENLGSEDLTVTLDDLKLTSSAGIGELRLAAPPLPWTIQPGKTQVIELQYAKPEAKAALIALLGYSFEIQGLP
jgi:hypothetical protein